MIVAIGYMLIGLLFELAILITHFNSFWSPYVPKWPERIGLFWSFTAICMLAWPPLLCFAICNRKTDDNGGGN